MTYSPQELTALRKSVPASCRVYSDTTIQLHQLQRRISKSLPDDWKISVDEVQWALVIQSTAPIAIGPPAIMQRVNPNIRVQPAVQQPAPQSQRLANADARTLGFAVRFEVVSLPTTEQRQKVERRNQRFRQERRAFEEQHLSGVSVYDDKRRTLPGLGRFNPQTPEEKDLIAEFELLWKRTTPESMPSATHASEDTAFVLKMPVGRIVDTEAIQKTKAMLNHVEETLIPTE